jgi:proline iminopeptidase
VRVDEDRSVALVIERRVETDDSVVLWTVEDGAGTPVALCHGGPGLWDYLAPVSVLARGSSKVVRWDQRGCGRSGATSSHSVRRYVEDLETIRKAYAVERWVVGGHSWGASLALRYALQHPDRTLGLIYLSGVGIGREWNAAYHVEADRRRTDAERVRLYDLASRSRTAPEEREYRYLSWLPDFATRRAAEEHIGQLDAPFPINHEANRRIVGETKQWDEPELALECATLTAPTLVVHGELDPRPAWAIDSLVAALPDATVETLSGAGHLPWLEDPAGFSRPLREFLAQF